MWETIIFVALPSIIIAVTCFFVKFLEWLDSENQGDGERTMSEKMPEGLTGQSTDEVLARIRIIQEQIYEKRLDEICDLRAEVERLKALFDLPEEEHSEQAFLSKMDNVAVLLERQGGELGYGFAKMINCFCVKVRAELKEISKSTS